MMSTTIETGTVWAPRQTMGAAKGPAATHERKRLRIGLVADPYLPVPPKHYGGIERVLAFLIEGLVDRGHEVVLWGHPESDVPCELIAYGAPPHHGRVNRLRELGDVAQGLLRRRSGLDVVHSFGRLGALTPLLFSQTPIIQSYQREITLRSIVWATRLSRGNLVFTACSSNCRSEVSHLGVWETIYNGVRLTDYTFRAAVAEDAPLVFLGRVERTKGAHTAIEIARRSGRRLVIAGNVSDDPQHRAYFETEVQPHVDEDRIEYIGPVDDLQKNRLLGEAAAFLMPIEWEEPFGIVMAEAMACGTPVIGSRRGSVPEVVEHGLTGFVCDTLDQMVASVDLIPTIDRHEVRSHCELRFGDSVIVDAYEQLYLELVARRK